MKEYRIVTNGTHYRVQVRGFFGWREPQEILYERHIAFKDFKTKKDAEKAMSEQIETDGYDARKWSPVK